MDTSLISTCSNFYSNLTIYTRFLLPSSALTTPPSLLPPHSSPLTPPPSLLLPHSSPSLDPPPSLLTTHSSPSLLLPHSSPLTPHHSVLPPHSPHTHTGLAGWGQLQNPSTAAAVQRRVPSSNLHTSPPPDVAIATGCALQASIMAERGRGRSEGEEGEVSGESCEGGVEVACVPADLWISVS